MNILITGGAGFIGSNLIDQLLLDKGTYVICIDNYDSFYDRSIKLKNQENHFASENFEFHELDIRNMSSFKTEKRIDCIIHLAAKAGVRPSISNPREYFDVNVNGTLEMLEFARNHGIKQFVFASSSSVYGINPNIPWSEGDMDLQPISPYASSKLACEKMGYTYSHLFGIRFIALRFFTVYGPRQRPDLAISLFFRRILNEQEIDMYGNGETYRDYTFVDDIVSGIKSAMNFADSNYIIINLGNNNPISLNKLISSISDVSGQVPKIKRLQEQIGDVPRTCANVERAELLLQFRPSTMLNVGLERQWDWIKANTNGTKNNL
jgi:UDP-glucuronate 4-epimerase